MTHEEVEAKLTAAKHEDGTFDVAAIAEMNAKGVYFEFTPQGVRYRFGQK